MGDVSKGSVQRSMTATLREFVQQNRAVPNYKNKYKYKYITNTNTLREFVQQNRAVPTGADYTVSLDSHDLK